MSWAAMTWRQIHEESKRHPTAVLPIGCVETQGAHIPVGLEYFLAQRLADEVAKRVDGVSLPCLPYGNSDAFKNLPGTIYVRPAALSLLYEDVLLSIIRSGYREILCIVTHAANQPLIEGAARAVREATGVPVLWINPGAMAVSMLPDHFENPQAARGHGAEPGASLARYLLDIEIPDQTAAERAPGQLRGLEVAGHILHFQGTPVGYPLQWEELYPHTGGYGDPTRGSKEIGRRMFDQIVETVVAVARAAQADKAEESVSGEP